MVLPCTEEGKLPRTEKFIPSKVVELDPLVIVSGVPPHAGCVPPMKFPVIVNPLPPGLSLSGVTQMARCVTPLVNVRLLVWKKLFPAMVHALLPQSSAMPAEADEALK